MTGSVSRRAFLGLAAGAFATLAAGGLSACGAAGSGSTLINVSYDPTREFYEAYNRLFNAWWGQGHGQQGVEVIQSHGGSGKQALEVANGLNADVVTLALAPDIDSLANEGLIASDWQSRLPNESSPYTSTIVFVVRRGNPLGIRDWADLAADGVGVIAPNPKTSGGARWNYLAAWAWAERQFPNEGQVKDYMRKLYGNVLVLDSGARASTTTFVENGQGDVLVSWENEAYLSVRDNPDGFEIVTPPVSILAQPPVSVVDESVDAHGTREVATAYLEHLYSTEAQRLCGENFYRPVDEDVLAEFSGTFPSLELATIDDFGGWAQAKRDHFDEGGTFDEIYGG
ncbi:sulfate ABC transporter substrate-binding protein [Olsenella uli]|uniref:sulfate ABC transporter substrate-binding protein n=1 Tax=Olsenella uli TaxID=133926 RepID=UPI0012ABD9EF|nr:sulfate ABC transporter substrate-binding protein [Olsenella uli]